MKRPASDFVSDNQWTFGMIPRVRPNMLHTPLPVTPKEVEPKTVFDPVRLSHQIAPQLHPLFRVQNTLEYRFLHTLLMVAANFRHAAQPAPARPLSVETS